MEKNVFTCFMFIFTMQHFYCSSGRCFESQNTAKADSQADWLTG